MTRPLHEKSITVLLVEDDAGDALMTQEAFGHADAPRPDLILLDLDLPGMGGHEVRADVKSDQPRQGRGLRAPALGSGLATAKRGATCPNG